MIELIKKWDIDIIVGPESRGFIFGTPLAYKLNVGFVPTRKKNKLPAPSIIDYYDTEYSKASLSIHKDSIIPGQKVLLVDDLLATGGTIKASANLVEQLGGKVIGAIFLVELTSLEGKNNLNDIPYHSLLKY